MNARNLTCACRDEHGFSLVEVVMATVILFFVSTALIGLAVSTMTTAMTAKEKNLMVNAVASYVEQLRSTVDYDDIGTQNAPAGEVSGTLSDETTLTVEGFNITITPQVFWVDDPSIDGTQDYKLLRITVEAMPVVGGRSISYVTETQIRDVDMSWGWSGSDAEAPTIEFVAGSPGEDSVVSGTQVLVGAIAESNMENGLITYMNFYCDSPLMQNLSDEEAAFTIGEKTPDPQIFSWDTLAESGGLPLSRDGIRSIKIEAWDNLSQQVFRIRRVLVDNYAPNAPEQPWVEWATDSTVHLAWDVAMDGTDPASSYFVRVYEDQAGVWVETSERSGVGLTETEYDLPVYAGSYVEPFRRFRVQLYAQSPNYPYSASTISTPFVSPPRLWGSWELDRDEGPTWATCVMSSDLYWSAPLFSVSETGTDFEYTLWRATDPGMLQNRVEVDSWTSPAQVSCHDEVVDVVGKKEYSPQYYYQLETQLIPTGPNTDGSTLQVWSNVAWQDETFDDEGEFSGEMVETW